jgi:hypothetical protein
LQKFGRSGTAEFLDKELNGLRASKKNLALEVEILEEANRQQAKIILHLRKKLAKFNESFNDEQHFDELQPANDETSTFSASSLLGIVPSISSLSSSLNAYAPNSSDDDFGSSTMLTECRSETRKASFRDKNRQKATPKLFPKVLRASSADNVQSSRPSRRTGVGSGIRRGLAPPQESPNHITWSQPHPEYEEVIRVCQTAKISDTAQAIMQNKQDESGTRLLIRLLSGLHPDPQLQ